MDTSPAEQPRGRFRSAVAFVQGRRKAAAPPPSSPPKGGGGGAADPQKPLAEFVDWLGSCDGPALWLAPTFFRQAAGACPRDALSDKVAEKMLALGRGEAFLAGGRAFARGALAAEFPELEVFRVPERAAFAPSPVYPGLSLETPLFASLCGLAPMRRELRRTGRVPGAAELEKVAALLGAPRPHGAAATSAASAAPPSAPATPSGLKRRPPPLVLEVGAAPGGGGGGGSGAGTPLSAGSGSSGARATAEHWL